MLALRTQPGLKSPIPPKKTGASGLNVLLVDVCHTLYKSNTMFDFLRWYLAGDSGYQRLQKLRGSLPVRVALKLSPRDFIRNKAVTYLKGHKQTDLLEAANRFIEQLVPIPETVEVLRQYQSRDYRIILLSASLDFIVDAVCRKIAADSFHASDLCYEDGICQGTFSVDLLAGKRRIIRQFFEGDTCDFITDNRTDLNCAALVNELIAVYSKHDSASASFWRRNNIRQTVTYE